MIYSDLRYPTRQDMRTEIARLQAKLARYDAAVMMTMALRLLLAEIDSDKTPAVEGWKKESLAYLAAEQSIRAYDQAGKEAQP